ncbi:MAG: glycosyltransferase [Syntrophobacterales bacterium]|jgi:GT2 family glycosyltransferase
MDNTTENVLISVVLGSYNRRRFLKAAIQSIRDNGISVSYEIVVVDGGSTDGSLRWLSRQKDIITIVQHNQGSFRGKPIQRRSWGYFMNLAFKCAHGKFIVMISDDSLLIPGSIMNGLNYFEDLTAQGRTIGALAFYFRNWPEQRQYFVRTTIGDKISVNHGMFRRNALEDVGWIEEERYQFYHADSDLSLKLWQRGYEVVDCPRAFVEHFRHANSTVRKQNMQSQKSDWSAYVDRWAGVFGNPDKDNSGGWIYSDYQDLHKTVNKFPKISAYKMIIISTLLSLKRRFE